MRRTLVAFLFLLTILSGRPVVALPAVTDVNRDSIAVIIGNRHYGMGVAEAEYADNDAAAMKEWLVNALGFREENIIYRRDATLAQLNQIFGTDGTSDGELAGRAKRNRSNVFVYYSGHGAPDTSNGEAIDRPAYLIPVDVDPNRARWGYSLDTLMRNLALIRRDLGSDRWMVVMLDACFSGVTPRGAALVKTSRGNLTPRPVPAEAGIVRINATRRDQVANWDDDAKLSLLTANFLSEAADFKGDSPVGAAWDDFASRVERDVAGRASAMGRPQDPEIDHAAIVFAPYTVGPVRPFVERRHDDADWERARSAGTREAAEDYLGQCGRRGPQGCRHRDEAAAFVDRSIRDGDLERDKKLWGDLSGQRRWGDYLSACRSQGTGCAFAAIAERRLQEVVKVEPPPPAAPQPTPELRTYPSAPPFAPSYEYAPVLGSTPNLVTELDRLHCFGAGEKAVGANPDIRGAIERYEAATGTKLTKPLPTKEEFDDMRSRSRGCVSARATAKADRTKAVESLSHSIASNSEKKRISAKNLQKKPTSNSCFTTKRGEKFCP